MVEHHGNWLRGCRLMTSAVDCGASSHRCSPTEKAPLRAGPFLWPLASPQEKPDDPTKEVAVYA